MKKEKSRTFKAKLNMSFSLLQQGIAFICGLIVPKLMLNAFGSQAYGATTSIATFLSYVTLLEGGIGAVTRSALYKAFASKSSEEVSAVISETKRFYQRIAIIFSIYVLIIACIYNQISHNNTFAFWYSFGLVIVIAISTFAEYFIGISYSLLLQADQMNYIVTIFRIITTVLNTICIVFLTYIKCDILTVKLASSAVFVIKPLLLSYYVNKRYKLTKVNIHKKLLKNKGSAVGQHIAWALHNNTDVTVLTLFKELTYVSVYSVHSMVINQLQSIINSFSSGMEAVFGSMIGNQEIENLKKTFGYYETLISLLSVTLFSTAAVMIVPFVRLYTSEITDADYINPAFAICLIVASLLYCMRTPYGNIVIAAGHYKETQIGAYGEAIINIITSIFLVIKYGLVGVAIGTILATGFRFVYYVKYLSRNIIHRPIELWFKRIVINGATFILIVIIGNNILLKTIIHDYGEWILQGIIVTGLSTVITLAFNIIFYKNDVQAIIKKGLGRFAK